MIRESIDIEALLIRAYCEKRVDRYGRGDDRQQRILDRLTWGSMPAGFRGGGFGGERVQTSCYASKLAARETRLWADLDLSGDPLLALHDAVLGLPTFYFERLGDLEFLVWDRVTALDMGHRIEVGKDGATIQRMRRRGGQDPKRADELRPAGAPRRLQAIEASTFLICHGRAADRPYVSPVVIEGRRPVYAGASKRAVAYEPVYETPLAQVVEDRAIYATWHACLGLLVTACGGFPSLDVTGPRAPAAPWDEMPAEDLVPIRRARTSARRATSSRARDLSGAVREGASAGQRVPLAT